MLRTRLYLGLLPLLLLDRRLDALVEPFERLAHARNLRRELEAEVGLLRALGRVDDDGRGPAVERVPDPHGFRAQHGGHLHRPELRHLAADVVDEVGHLVDDLGDGGRWQLHFLGFF